LSISKCAASYATFEPLEPLNSTSVPVTISSFVGVKVTVESPPDAILNAFSLASSKFLSSLFLLSQRSQQIN
jgi:hypothetical protein